MAAAADALSFELDINDNAPPTAEQVLEFRCPTQGYMCPLSANTYGIDFLSFRIRDYNTSRQLFEVARDPDAPPVDVSQIPPEMEDQVRCISYDFGADFLNLETIGTTLEFSVGPREVDEFRMIERHYFRDTLIKSYDFMFGFCIPNSTNTWEAIYDMPELPPDLLQEMIDNPWETESDSFYYVGETMIMHNKVRPSAHRGAGPLLVLLSLCGWGGEGGRGEEGATGRGWSAAGSVVARALSRAAGRLVLRCGGGEAGAGRGWRREPAPLLFSPPRRPCDAGEVRLHKIVSGRGVPRIGDAG